jgi:uncharacterized membrane protein
MPTGKHNLLFLSASILVFILGFVSVFGDSQYCHVTITVLDEELRIPIAGARVTWSGGELTTDERGQVSFGVILFSDNRVYATKEGYETDSVWVYCRSCSVPISETIYLKKITLPQYCTLDIYSKDQDGNSLDADIYVDNSFKGYDDHLSVGVELGTHTVEARKTGYYSDTTTVTCSIVETRRVDLTLRKIEEGVRIKVSDFDVSPDEICSSEYETIHMSVRVNLEGGPDDTLVTTQFYIEDNEGNWYYVGKDEKYLDRGETRTFDIDFDYSPYLFDEGIHDVRARVEAREVIENIYSELEVRECIDRYRIEVGFISLENDYPEKGEIISASVPITLNYAPLPETIYVKVYVDNSLLYSESMRFYELGTNTFRFTIDTSKYATGPHTLRVKAEVDTKSDTSTRTFSISPVGYYVREEEHCLSIEKVWVEGELKPGESNRVNVRVLSCGTKYEKNVRMKLEAFSKTFYTGEFDVPAGGSRDVFVTITVPEDASGKQAFRVTVWNAYTSDAWSKEFEVQAGIPYVEINPEFVVESCKKKKISFDLVNKGKVSDTFAISVSGIGAEWITDVPETVTLNPDERKTITAYVSAPCDAEEGYYEFTVKARDSIEYYTTSSIRVIRAWRFPTLPTGMFVWSSLWLWILIILFIIFVVILFGVYWSFVAIRKRPMFE